MGLMSGIARLLLVIINIVFLLAGLGVTAVGFLLRFGGDVINKALEIGTDQLARTWKDSSVGDLKNVTIDLTEITEGLAIGLIVGGLVLVAISVFGCCGACYKIKVMLWIYAIVIVVFIIAEGVVIGLLYGKPEIIKSGIKKSLDSYTGFSGKDMVTLGWNIIMIQFKCCGVDNYKDFASATKWNKTLDGKLPAGQTLNTPLVCCKNVPAVKSSTIAQQPACTSEVNGKIDPAISNGNTGCFDTLWDMSFGNTAIAVPVLVVCGIIQLVFIVFVCIIVKKDKDKVSPI